MTCRAVCPRPTDRTGLYLIVIAIWFTTCDTNSRVEKIQERCSPAVGAEL